MRLAGEFDAKYRPDEADSLVRKPIEMKAEVFWARDVQGYAAVFAKANKK
jgi:hypothetical protein